MFMKIALQIFYSNYVFVNLSKSEIRRVTFFWFAFFKADTTVMRIHILV